ncbi:MAG TPA: MFS transporter [Stellaceae bacterium]|nr:MFS transporter [Stellaceae bacterium]
MGILETERDRRPGRRKPLRGCDVPAVASGPVVVAAVFCLVFLLMGTAFSFSIFAAALQRALGAGSGSISLIFGGALALLYVGGFPAGILADRIGTQWVAGAGAALAGGSLVIGGMVRTIWQADAALGLGFGLGLAVAYSPAVAAVQPWFDRNRGVASGIALSGTGLGTLLMPLLALWLSETRGWRTALTAIGLAVMGLGATAAYWIRRPPGSPSAPFPRRADGSLYRIARAPAFRWLYVGGFLSSFALLVPIVQTIPHAVRGGIPPQQATWLISILGFGSVAGRLILGPVADRLGRQRILGALYAVLGALFLIWTCRVGFAVMALFALAYGVCYGATIALRPAVIADHFAGPNLAAVTGLHYTGSAVGTLLGPAAFGYAVEWWHSDLVPVCVAAASLCGAGYFFAARPPQARRGGPCRRR